MSDASPGRIPRIPWAIEYDKSWRAALAFAARCVKRVEMLITHHAERNDWNEEALVYQVLTELYDLSMGKCEWHEIKTPEQEATRRSLLERMCRVPYTIRPALECVYAATQACDTMRIAHGFLMTETLTVKQSRLPWCYIQQCCAEMQDAFSEIADVSGEIERDLQVLLTRAESFIFSDSPFPLALFGSLWPNGRPMLASPTSSPVTPLGVVEARDTSTSPAPPVSSQPNPNVSPVQQRSALADLHRWLVDHFDAEDLEKLCVFYLDVPLREVCLPANTDYTAFRLIEWCKSRGRIPDLLSSILSLRRGVDGVKSVTDAVFVTLVPFSNRGN